MPVLFWIIKDSGARRLVGGVRRRPAGISQCKESTRLGAVNEVVDRVSVEDLCAIEKGYGWLAFLEAAMELDYGCSVECTKKVTKSSKFYPFC